MLPLWNEDGIKNVFSRTRKTVFCLIHNEVKGEGLCELSNTEMLRKFYGNSLLRHFKCIKRSHMDLQDIKSLHFQEPYFQIFDFIRTSSSLAMFWKQGNIDTYTQRRNQGGSTWSGLPWLDFKKYYFFLLNFVIWFFFGVGVIMELDPVS